MYSNAYIFRYAAIMVILVAAILSTAAMLLKPYQERNISIDKMQGILASVSIEATSENAIEKYDKYVTSELVIDPDGNVVSEYKNGAFVKGDQRAFDMSMKVELYKKAKGENYTLPLLVADINNVKSYIIPLYGKGLWGPVWGNIAVKENGSTVIGVSFDHKSETPGLGAEISTKPFEDQFIGKEIMNSEGEFMSIKVVKGGIDMIPESLRIHGVDAISGGTITSNAVADMLNDCLESYVPFLKNTGNR